MSRPRVLIVDDDITICEEVGAGLERHGFLMQAATEPSGCFLTADFHPDVIVLDLDMPGIDGFQVIERLGRMPRRPQLIVASGHHSRIIQAAARGAAAAGIPVLGQLEKPYAVKQLVGLLDGYRRDAPPPVDETQRVAALIESGNLNGLVRVAFQSKRIIETAEIVGYEALMRVSDGYPVNPELFFKPAVDHAVQLALSATVLDRALAFARALSDAGQPLSLAVNCTPAIICDPAFNQIVQNALAHNDVPPSSLLLEITEHSSLNSLEEVGSAAGRLALRKIGIVVDDFGRGTTSFEKFLDLPLTELKIDKDLFWMVMSGEIAPGLIKEVVSFCAERGILTTIEGIETEAHRKLAGELGAHTGQGYLWDRPRFVNEILPR